MKEICEFIQHYAHHILHNLWPMYENTLKTSLCFEFKEFIRSTISSSGSTGGMKFRSAEV